MTSLTLKGLLGRKLRATLTALAIILGVAMVSGTYVLTDTIQKAFDGIFSESYEGTDVVVTGRQITEYSASGRATVPVSLLTEIEALPGVAAAAGGIIDLQNNSNPAKLVGSDGKTIGGGEAPALGVGLDPDRSDFSPLRLVEGDWARSGGQIVIDAGTASEQELGVGDEIGVAALGPIEQYRIVGIANFGSVESLGGATIAVFDLETAQSVFNKDGRFDSISIAAEDGVSPEELVREIRPILPQAAEARTGGEQAALDSKETNEGIAFITYFLLAFGGIALFVGAFVIFNTLSITVAQRIREFATVRTLGASRRQVLRSVVLEALLIGLAASVLGLFLGLGLGKGLNSLFVAFGIDLPQAGTVFALRTVVVSLLVGTGITMLASLVPAFRATRVPPISAVREGATLPKSRLASYTPYIGIGTVALAVLALGVGMFAGGLETASVILLLGTGVLALFIGVALLSSRLVKPLAALVGLPARKLGGTAGDLARDNAVRNPSRTAATAAALMIGLALVTFVAVLGSALRSSDERAITSQFDADYVIVPENGFDPFPAAAADTVASAPELTSSVRADQVRFGDADVALNGIEPATIGHFYHYEWEQGSDSVLATLGSDGAIVQAAFARKHELASGSSFSVLTPAGDRVRLVVRGIADPPRLDPLLGDIQISQTAFDASFADPRNRFTFLDLGGEVNEATRSELQARLDSFPDTKLQTKAEFVTDRFQNFETILNLLYVLLALSVIVSLFGMVNTLVLSVFERTKELGMLRAIGMTRSQARRMIRYESVITALIGAVLGMPLGIFLAALVARGLSDYDVTISIPTVTLAVFVLVAIGAGILAALLPARRAAHLDPLAALHYE